MGGKTDVWRPPPQDLWRVKRRVVVLIPAYNEAEMITAALTALNGQSNPPDMVLVVADNCTDNTAELAELAGADVLVTVNNPHKRAGALNQAVAHVLNSLNGSDIVVLTDADTILNRDFLRNAAQLLTSRYNAVGPTFDAAPSRNILETLQNNEYTRYSRMVGRRDGRTLNLSGAAQALTVDTVRCIIAARAAGDLPGEAALYNTDSISEDMELTIALKTMGFTVTSSPLCRCVTDVMSTRSTWWTQRVRWIQGGMKELQRYGWTSVTRPMILRQIAAAFNILFTVGWISYAVLLTVLAGISRFDLLNEPPWIAVIVFFSAERAWTTRRAGRTSALVAALIIPELVYELARQCVFAVSLVRHIRGRSIVWE